MEWKRVAHQEVFDMEEKEASLRPILPVYYLSMCICTADNGSSGPHNTASQ
jgi:hypothetical protein